MAFVTPEEVREDVGIVPDWLGFDNDSELDQWLERRIEAAEELVARYTGASYSEADVPAGVKDAVSRIVGNMIGQARLHRNRSIVSIDDFGNQRTAPLPAATGQVFTPDIKEDLDLYVIKQGGASGTVFARGTVPLSGLSGDGVNYYPDTFGDWTPLRGLYPFINREQLP